MQIQILKLTSATTPALVTAQANVDPTYGTGYGFGRLREQQIRIQAVRGSTSMTAVIFAVQGCFDVSVGSPIWIPIPVLALTDVTGTPVASYSLAVSSGSTAENALIGVDLYRIPFVRVTAQAVTADASTGDSCSAWLVQS